MHMHLIVTTNISCKRDGVDGFSRIQPDFTSHLDENPCVIQLFSYILTLEESFIIFPKRLNK